MLINTIQAQQIKRFLESNAEYKKQIDALEDVKYTDCDTEQVGIKISEDIWLYSERDENNVLEDEPYRTEFMFFSDFDTKEAQESAISGYYDSVEEVKNTYKEGWKQIILECAFEQDL